MRFDVIIITQIRLLYNVAAIYSRIILTSSLVNVHRAIVADYTTTHDSLNPSLSLIGHEGYEIAFQVRKNSNKKEIPLNLKSRRISEYTGAGNEIRTRDPRLGKPNSLIKKKG